MQEPEVYIQHPKSLTIEVRQCTERPETEQMMPLGLICPSEVEFSAGQIVELIDPNNPQHEPVVAQVRWCRRQKYGFQLGLGFRSEEELYRARMFEQICHIRLYQQEELAQGRELSSEHAAVEWISKYASQFPTDGL